MPTRKIFQPLDEDEGVNEVTTISQCVDALDAAAMLYSDVKDAEGLLQVANGYLQMSKHLSDLREANVLVNGKTHGGKRQVDNTVKVGFTLPEDFDG